MWTGLEEERRDSHLYATLQTRLVRTRGLQPWILALCPLTGPVFERLLGQVAAEKAQHGCEVKQREEMMARTREELGLGGQDDEAAGGKKKTASKALGALSKPGASPAELLGAKRPSSPGKGGSSPNKKDGERPRSPVKAGQMTAEELKAASRLGPDGLPRVDMLRAYNEALEAYTRKGSNPGLYRAVL